MEFQTTIHPPDALAVTQFLGRLQQRDPTACITLFGEARWTCVDVCACASTHTHTIGLATLAPRDKLGSDEPHITGLYVLPEYRKTGCGRALVTALVEESLRAYQTPPTIQARTPDQARICRKFQNIIMLALLDIVCRLPIRGTHEEDI
jgi:GNAT superfamily N-acetyltransferase